MAWLDWQGFQYWTLKWSRSTYLPRSSLSRRHNFPYFTFKHDGFCRYLHQGSFWSFGHGFISSLPHPEYKPSSPNKLLQGIRLLGWSFVSHITNIGNWLFLRFFFFASKETSFSRQLMDIDFLPNIVNSISNFWRYNLHLIDFLKPIWQASFSSIVVWNNLLCLNAFPPFYNVYPAVSVLYPLPSPVWSFWKLHPILWYPFDLNLAHLYCSPQTLP